MFSMGFGLRVLGAVSDGANCGVGEVAGRVPMQAVVGLVRGG